MLRTTWPLSYMRRRSSSGLGTGPYSSNRWRVNVSQTVTVGNWTALREVEWLNELGADMANGGTASASAGTASAAFDNSAATQWSTGTGTKPQWIEYQFPQAVAPNSCRLTGAGNGGDCPRDFTLEYYDGSSWQVAKTITGAPWFGGAVRDFPIGSTLATSGYGWRVQGVTTQGAGAWVKATEIEFRETVGGADATSGGGTFASSNSVNNGANKAFDNDTNSYWQAVDGNPHNVGYAFASAVTIAQMSMRNGSPAGDSWTAFKLQRHDSESWVDVLSVTGQTWTANETKVFTV